MSVPESRVWIKFFLPCTYSATDIVQRLPKTEPLFAQELSWNAIKLRGVLLQRLTWACDWRRNQGLNEFSTEELILHVGGDVSLALAQQVHTPRELLTSAHNLIIHALLGRTELPIVPLTLEAWQSFTTPVPLPASTSVSATVPLSLSGISQTAPGRKNLPQPISDATLPCSQIAADAKIVPNTPSTAVSGPPSARRKLTIEMSLLEENPTKAYIRYEEPRVRKHAPLQADLPYTLKRQDVNPPLSILRKALDQNCQDEAYFKDKDWSYLRNQKLREGRSSRVNPAIRQLVGVKLFEVLSQSKDFIQDLWNTNLAADIQLLLRQEDSLLACFPWELITYRSNSLLLQSVGLTRHLHDCEENHAGQRPLRVLYVAPRPVLAKDIWPGYDADDPAASLINEDNRGNRVAVSTVTEHVFVDAKHDTVRTIAELRRRLENDPEISAIHFDGHVMQVKGCITCRKWKSVDRERCPECGKRLTGDAQTILAFEQSSTDNTLAPSLSRSWWN